MDPVVRDILDQAFEEFAEHGLAGARVDAIADRTRTSKRMLYYHFGSKEGLYAAVLAHAYRLLRESTSTLPEPDYASLSALDALRAWAGHVFDVHVAHPRQIRLIMGENLLGARFVRQDATIQQANQEGLSTLAAIVQRGQAEASIRADLKVLDLYASAVGLAFHFVSNRATFSAIFEQSLAPATVQMSRRAAVVETIARQALAWPVVASVSSACPDQAPPA